MSSRHRTALYAPGLAFFLCIAGSPDALSQPAPSAPAMVDTFIAVVPPRSPEEITKDTDRAGALRTQTKQVLARAQEDLSSLENIITLRKKDLDAFEEYLDGLDAEKQSQAHAAAQKSIASMEKLIDLLEVRRDAREAEVECAQATIAYTEALEAFYALEGRLVSKRSDRASLTKKPGSSNDLAAMDRLIAQLEDEVLDRWEDAVGRHKECATAESDYLKRLRKHGEAQRTYNTP